MQLTSVRLEPPYLLYLGDTPDNDHAKTGHGIAYWRPERCAGQMRLPDCPVDLGLPGFTLQNGAASFGAGVFSNSGQVLGSTLTYFVDIGDLDASVLVGYPGTIASLWQAWKETEGSVGFPFNPFSSGEPEPKRSDSLENIPRSNFVGEIPEQSNGLMSWLYR